MQISALPIVMIPAAALLSLTFNNRLMPLLRFIRDTLLSNAATEETVDLMKKTFHARVVWLRLAIIGEYSAIMCFTVASILLLIGGGVSKPLIYITLTFMLAGCLLVFLGTVAGMIEIVNSLNTFNIDVYLKKSKTKCCQ